MIALALLLAAQALPAPGSVTEWEALPDDQSGRNFLDPASIRRDGDIAYAMVRGVAHPGDTDAIQSAMMRIRIDCRARTFGFEAVDAYGADGRFLRSREVAPGAVASRPTGELASFVRLVERACGR